MRREIPGSIRRPVRGGVVDDDQLVAVLKLAGERRERVLECIGALVGDDDGGDPDVSGQSSASRIVAVSVKACAFVTRPSRSW